MMRITPIALYVAIALAGSGCGNSNPAADLGAADLAMRAGDMAVTVDMSPSTPVAPDVGKQIDRMGRPGINVALTDPFGITMAGQGPTRDAYNTDSNEATWAATWTVDLQTMLEVYDGADRVCGNQFLACGKPMGCTQGDPVDQMRYKPLARALTDDRLYVNTAGTACTAYLAVEATSVGVTGLDQDCGGRTPLYDVIDETYTAMTVGISGFLPQNKFAVTDGTTGNLEAAADPTKFPFIGAPN